MGDLYEDENLTFTDYMRLKIDNFQLLSISRIIFLIIIIVYIALLLISSINITPFSRLNNPFHFWYYFFLEVLFLETMLLGKQPYYQESNRFDKTIELFRDILNDFGWRISAGKFTLLVLFHGLSGIYLIIPDYWYFGAIRDFVLVGLLLSIVYTTDKDKEAPSELIKYPLSMIILLILVSVAYNLIQMIFYETNIVDFPLFLITVPLVILLLIGLGIIHFLEKQGAKYIQFRNYEQRFSSADQFRTNSITSFIAKFPAKIAKIRYYVNILYGIGGSGLILSYIVFTIVMNSNFGAFELFSLIITVGFTALILILTSKGRNKLGELMNDYTLMVNRFEERNQKMMNILDQNDPTRTNIED